jgi:hypothetical protein
MIAIVNVNMTNSSGENFFIIQTRLHLANRISLLKIDVGQMLMFDPTHGYALNCNDMFNNSSNDIWLAETGSLFVQ